MLLTRTHCSLSAVTPILKIISGGLFRYLSRSEFPIKDHLSSPQYVTKILCFHIFPHNQAQHAKIMGLSNSLLQKKIKNNVHVKYYSVTSINVSSATTALSAILTFVFLFSFILSFTIISRISVIFITCITK